MAPRFCEECGNRVALIFRHFFFQPIQKEKTALDDDDTRVVFMHPFPRSFLDFVDFLRGHGEMDLGTQTWIIWSVNFRNAYFSIAMFTKAK